MTGGTRPRGIDAYDRIKREAPELFGWYYDGFYQHVFYEGRVERRFKELLRLKLSKTQGCFT
jgi:hypothetical protein